MRNREIIGRFEQALEPFVHGQVASDPVAAPLHRRFMAAHFISGLIAFCLIPLCFAFDVTNIATVAMALLGLEGLIALYVSRTGNLPGGYLLSAVVLTAVVAWVATFTGGLASFAVVWFAVVPIEAALSASRRVILGATGIAVAGLAAVGGLTFAGVLPAGSSMAHVPMIVTAGAGLVALVYAAGIAARIQGNQRLAGSRAERGEERYHLLADAMTDIVTCHDARGDVGFATPATERLLGIKPSLLHGEGLFHRVHIADRPAYLTALSQAIHAGSAAVEFRLRAGDVGDEESWIWAESYIRRAENATIAGTVAIAVTRDISHRKSQQIELDRAREDAEAASFAKTRFLANMSHELRTPLNAIIGFSDILEQEIFGKFEYDRHREYSRLIKESGEHLLQVVNDILDMSKIEAGSFDVNKEPFDIAALADRVRQLMQQQAATAGVDLTLDVESDLPELCADRRACRQILLNLLSNALKFTNAGGKVVCDVRRKARNIVMTVRDTGIGISAEDLPRLGRPFVQADSGYDRRHAGTGLGLSVVKGLVALHGGTMSIDSVLGEGTSVAISLPISGEREPVALRMAPGVEVGSEPRRARRA